MACALGHRELAPQCGSIAWTHPAPDRAAADCKARARGIFAVDEKLLAGLGPRRSVRSGTCWANRIVAVLSFLNSRLPPQSSSNQNAPKALMQRGGCCEPETRQGALLRLALL